MSNAIQYTLSEATSIIKTIIQANNNSITHDRIAIGLVGKHGLGKSAFVKGLSEKEKMNFHKLTLPNYDDTSALLGYPRKTWKAVKENKEGNLTTRHIEAGSIETYRKAGFKISRDPSMTYAEPEWLSFLSKDGKPSILFIDEYNRALSFIKAAVMELINSGEYGTYKLPKNCTIVVASNPNDGNYNITSPDDDAQGDRIVQIPVKFDAKAWAEWAEEVGINEAAINFILSVPEATTGDNSLSIRRWTKFFSAIHNVPDMDSVASLDLISSVGQVSVGNHVTTFINYVKNNLDIIPRMEYIFDPLSQEAAVLESIKQCVIDRDTGVQRQDIRALIGLRMKNFIKTRNSVDTKFIDRLKLILTSDVLYEDSLLMLVTDITSNSHPHKSKMTRLLADNKIQDILLKSHV